MKSVRVLVLRAQVQIDGMHWREHKRQNWPGTGKDEAL